MHENALLFRYIGKGGFFMLRSLLSLVLAALLSLTPLLPAQANSWGLKSGYLLSYVTKTKVYNAYSAIAEVRLDDYHIAVLEAQYHRLLMIADKSGLVAASTAAVYQPGEEKRLKATLEKDGENGFALRLGENETYHFAAESGVFYLQKANFDSSVMTPVYDGDAIVHWRMEDEAVTAVPLKAIPLDRFNPRVLPRSALEADRMAKTHALLTLYSCDLTENLYAPTLIAGSKNGPKSAVYSAPDAASWRAAKGKASVSFKDDVYELFQLDSYRAVLYAVSERTRRIGYVADKKARASVLLSALPAAARTKTSITDDPTVSNFAHAALDPATGFTVLGYAGGFAYVESELENKTARGFVPLKDAALTAPLAPDQERLLGYWQRKNGDYFSFYTSGLMHYDCFTGNESAVALADFGYWELLNVGGETCLLMQTEDGVYAAHAIAFTGSGFTLDGAAFAPVDGLPPIT